VRTKRALTTLAVTLLAAAGVATAYSPAASAASTVWCQATTNDAKIYWFNCYSSNGAQTIWYVNGVHQSSVDGASAASFSCLFNQRYTISVNTGTSLAASWTQYCNPLKNPEVP
jgi:spore coat protein U-like protein